VSSDVIEPAQLEGQRVVDVTLGWHIHGDHEEPVLYFLWLGDGEHVELHTPGDGSIALRRGTAPTDFDMGDYGRFEFRTADARSPIRALVGRKITRVQRIRWRGHDVGLRMRADDDAVVIVANEADEVFTSDGQLPPDYRDAVIE
jgi:hypothetical protein